MRSKSRTAICISTSPIIMAWNVDVDVESMLMTWLPRWYRTSEPIRPLLDFEKFDDAARDPISAIGLLFRVRTR